MQEVKLAAPLRVHNGFYYIQIPEQLVEAFLPLIPRECLSPPCDVIDESKYIGPHISVILPEESKRLNKKVREVGQCFSFTIDRLYSTQPERWYDVQEVYFIGVKSPELELLRKKFKLKPKPNGHDFHITVAVWTRGSISGENKCLCGNE